MQPLDKSLPYNHQAEKILLGAILLDGEHMASAAESLVPEDFYTPQLRAIYGAMTAVYAEGKVVTPLEVAEALKTQGIDKPISEVMELTYGLPFVSDIEEYIDVIREKSTARRFIRTCNGAISEAVAESEKMNSIIDGVEQELFKLRDVAVKDAPQTVGELALFSVQDSVERSKSGESILGLETGFSDIDVLTGGLQKTDLIIVAARPSMGKSAFSLDMAKGVCARNRDAVVAYFSLEMSKRQCADRLICSMARVHSNRYRIGMLTQTEWERVTRAAEELAQQKIYIDDKSSSSVFDIKSKSRKILAEHQRLDLIVIDYLQLMRGTRSENRQQEVSDISRDLKALAKDLKVPVVALSQLSRQCEARQDKRPLLSDLRESGAIEQDADIVAFLYRDEYYNEPTPETAGVAELIFRKHRHGATDTVRLAFFKDFAQFGNRGYN